MLLLVDLATLGQLNQHYTAYFYQYLTGISLNNAWNANLIKAREIFRELDENYLFNEKYNDSKISVNIL